MEIACLPETLSLGSLSVSDEGRHERGSNNALAGRPTQCGTSLDRRLAEGSRTGTTGRASQNGA